MLESMLDPRLLAPERVRPLLRREYDRLVELGAFQDERVELLRGQLVVMSPQGGAHATITARLHGMLVEAIGIEQFDIRSHSPFAALEDSEPEPDVSVSKRRKSNAYHPSHALLVVEVADSSLRIDRQIKAAIYAENGAPEYWIVDVRKKVVYVFSKPKGGTYADVVEVPRTGTLRPTKLPGVRVSVAKLFGLR